MATNEKPTKERKGARWGCIIGIIILIIIIWWIVGGPLNFEF